MLHKDDSRASTFPFLLLICHLALPRTGLWVRSIWREHCRLEKKSLRPVCWRVQTEAFLYIDEVNLLEDHLVDLLLVCGSVR